jgi:hypothetical protein
MRVFDIHLAEMTFIIDVKEPVESSGTVVKKVCPNDPPLSLHILGLM